MVWAEDPETGERALKRVVRTFLNESDELVHVKVNGETITCTPEHPFYVYGAGWVAAKDLKPDYRLVLQNGRDVSVDAIWREKLAEPTAVYNFEVEDFHTYYVGSSCILVHNQCVLPKNNSKMTTSQALDAAEDFLGEGYKHMGNGRYVSADGLRQVRIGDSDILGLHGPGPHINFDRIKPTHKGSHVLLID